MVFRFLHLADLHLETHFGGRPQAKRRLREATLAAFENAVGYAIEQQLHAVLVAGDLFDDPLLSLRTELFFVRQVERLARSGVWFVAVCGNHDPGGPNKRTARLGFDADSGDEPWRERIQFFRKSQPEHVTITDTDGRAVAIVAGAGHSSEREERNLVTEFVRLDTELPVVGLVHTQVESARAAENHDRYAPSTERDFAHQGYAYWALGHVHLRQRAVPDAPAWYAGNLQGRNTKETGPKGGLLVSIEADSDLAEPTFVPFAPVRFETCSVENLASCETLAAVVNQLSSAIDELRETTTEELIPVLELHGACPLAASLKNAEARSELEDELIELTGCVDVRLRADALHRPHDLDKVKQSPTVLAKAIDWIERARYDDEALLALEPAILAGAPLPQEAADTRPKVEYLRGLLDQLEHDLVDRCLSEEHV